MGKYIFSPLTSSRFSAPFLVPAPTASVTLIGSTSRHVHPAGQVVPPGGGLQGGHHLPALVQGVGAPGREGAPGRGVYQVRGEPLDGDQLLAPAPVRRGCS